MADIYLLGSGVRSFLDITLETQNIIQSCNVVYCLHDLPSLERYLDKVCKRVINLMPIYYKDGANRNDIYAQIVNHVIEHAKIEKPVALLLHGHPLVFSSISQLLLTEAPKTLLDVETHAGVSSLDQLFVELKLDIAANGVQIFNAPYAINRTIPLNPHVDCILLQVTHVTSMLAQRKVENQQKETIPLQSYLEQFYPPKQPVYIVECAVEIGIPSQITTTTVGDLPTHAARLNYNASMYIPAQN